MILFKEATALIKYINICKQHGSIIGFAPTMGALHTGHLSLIEKSMNICDISVSSIFINPTQFNDSKDFEKYPVTIENDILLLENAGCDVLFLPSVLEIYPSGNGMFTRYDLGEIEFLLEGKFRPGHFQGVSQVVHRLLNIVHPDILLMGQKDYQQCIIVKRLVQMMNLPVKVTTVATYREPTGLAMSSRNFRLNGSQKEAAAGISTALHYIKDNYTAYSLPELEKYSTDYLLNNGFRKVDYVSIADAETLQQVTDVTKGQKLVALIAAYMGDVRLIDNLVL